MQCMHVCTSALHASPVATPQTKTKAHLLKLGSVPQALAEQSRRLHVPSVHTPPTNGKPWCSPRAATPQATWTRTHTKPSPPTFHPTSCIAYLHLVPSLGMCTLNQLFPLPPVDVRPNLFASSLSLSQHLSRVWSCPLPFDLTFPLSGPHFSLHMPPSPSTWIPFATPLPDVHSQPNPSTTRVHNLKNGRNTANCSQLYSSYKGANPMAICH